MMNAVKLLQKVEFVVDEQGNKKAVLLDYKVWEDILTQLEDSEDAQEIKRLREAGEGAIPWQQAKDELQIDV